MAVIRLDGKCYLKEISVWNVDGLNKERAIICYSIQEATRYTPEQITENVSKLRKLYVNPIVEVIEE